MGSIPIGSATGGADSMAQPRMTAARTFDLLRRLAATAYDLIVLAGVLAASSLAIVLARGGEAVPTGSRAFQAFLVVQVAAYFAGFWRHGGQTPGMRPWHLCVQTAAGTTLTWQQAITRLGGALLSIASLGLGLAWLLVDRHGLAWHDRLSGTRVVRTTPS